MAVFEVEQKFRVDEHDQVAARLSAMGATPGEEITQVDTYFAHPSRDFAKTDEALRIRQVGERNFVTFKGPKAKAAVKTRREIELPLGDGSETAEQMADVWIELGFRRVAEVRKQRRPLHLVWQGADVEVALDEVKGVGRFVELELVSQDEGVAKAQSQIEQLALELGLTRVERSSYLAMLLRMQDG